MLLLQGWKIGQIQRLAGEKGQQLANIDAVSAEPEERLHGGFGILPSGYTTPTPEKPIPGQRKTTTNPHRKWRYSVLRGQSVFRRDFVRGVRWMERVVKKSDCIEEGSVGMGAWLVERPRERKRWRRSPMASQSPSKSIVQHLPAEGLLATACCSIGLGGLFLIARTYLRIT